MKFYRLASGFPTKSGSLLPTKRGRELPTLTLIRVADTGRGIPEHFQRSVFQPFFRVDKSRSREYGGVGLGLALVWKIAELHGGSVWVEESTGAGTTMAAALPLR